MTPGAMITFEERVSVPVSALTLDGFRRWACSPEFPETGRIDFLAGSVEVDMSPEDLFTHGEPKAAISSTLHRLVVDPGLGHLFIDRSRVSSIEGDLSVEPDVIAVLWDTVRSGRARWVPTAKGEPDRYIEIEGAVDLAVEIVSDGSVKKDTEKLPVRYALAGVGEFWLVDARGKKIRFEIGKLEGGEYAFQRPDRAGWIRSPLLGARFRLTRTRTPIDTWTYQLEHRP